MKKFKLKFSPVLYALLVLLIAISILGVIVNVVRFFNPFLKSFRTARPIVFGVLSVVLLIFALLILFRSKYVFKNGELYFFVGVFKFKLGAKEVVFIKEYKEKNLVLYFNDTKFTVILINPKNFALFTKELKEINNKIFYEVEE